MSSGSPQDDNVALILRCRSNDLLYGGAPAHEDFIGNIFAFRGIGLDIITKGLHALLCLFNIILNSPSGSQLEDSDQLMVCLHGVSNCCIFSKKTY